MAAELVSVLIPAYNETERIAETIGAIKALHISQASFEIIVVDDGSSDNTAGAADSAGADIVLVQRNSGKGAALNAGRALASGGILLLLDADLGRSAADSLKLLKPVIEDGVDMTIATFPVVPGKGGGAGLVVRSARWGIHQLTGRRMQAPLSGQRALRRSVLDICGGFAPGWGVEIALTVCAVRAGFHVEEIATGMTHRVTGRSAAAILHRASQFTAVWRTLAKLWWTTRSAPLSINKKHDAR